MAAKIWKRDRREEKRAMSGHMFVSTSLSSVGRGRERWMGERRTSTGQQTSPFMGATNGGTKKCKAVPFIAFIIHHSQSNLHFERMRRASGLIANQIPFRSNNAQRKIRSSFWVRPCTQIIIIGNYFYVLKAI